jgi:hypothetical protein
MTIFTGAKVGMTTLSYKAASGGLPVEGRSRSRRRRGRRSRGRRVKRKRKRKRVNG